MSVWGIVLGAGSGARFGGAKQFLELTGVTLLERSVTAARTACDGVVAVVPDPTVAMATAMAADAVVAGGVTRSGSVRAGLAAVPTTAEVIVVADAAHPLASPALFSAVVKEVLDGAEGAFPGLAMTEAIAEVLPDGTRGEAMSRRGRVLVQTPQAFRAELLRAVHAQGAEAVEDSASVAAMTVGGRPARVVIVPGDPFNVHVTTTEELDLARALVR